MSRRPTQPLSLKRIIIGTLIGVLILAGLLLPLFIGTTSTIPIVPPISPATVVAPFPIGVDPRTQTIVEQPLAEEYLEQYIASNHTKSRRFDTWLAKARAVLESFAWYQQLAAPRSRTVVVWSGERAEQIAHSFGQILTWTPAEQAVFREHIEATAPAITNGKYYPGRYIFHDNATATSAAAMVLEAFTTNVQARYSPDVAARVPLTDALIIASLIEREAHDFSDMRYISGVIWNRLFIDMPLQLDASLQYARGAPGSNRSWWPVPVPRDKFIDSPFNTYQNTGLPPAPISNPSVDAIIAALNPRATDCLFYFHDAQGGFHCTETYEEHVQLLREYY